MGRRSTWRDAQADRERMASRRTNPVWRGVGCILIVVMGGLGYLFANWFLPANAENRWIPLPAQLINPPGLPFLAGGVAVKLAVGFLFLLFAFAIMNFIYAIAFPVKPGEFDVRTEKRRRRRR